MDSVTQVLLGSAVAAAVAPSSVKKRAIVAGAVLGTIPDLDVLIHYVNDIDVFTRHRSFSHSLIVLPFFALVLLPLLKRIFPTLSLMRLYCLIALSLMTHPLLDALTSYGTQLFYPFDATPTFIASVFIIDPFYSSWLLLGLIFYWFSSRWRWANTTGLLLSTVYLGIGVFMHHSAEETLRAAYPQTQGDKWFVGVLTASPLCWRGVYRHDNYYIEAAFNVLNPDEMAVRRYSIVPTSQYPKTDDWKRLQWFNPDTVLRQRGGRIISSDLRMGEFGLHVFEFDIAPDSQTPSKKLPMYDKPQWQSIEANDAAIRYEQKNDDPSFPKRKWKQFMSCLSGGL